ncbi:MAG TPA: hypothetical protein VIF60_13955 [Burkholderiaceae bacterium]|jgi:hypothetical protein
MKRPPFQAIRQTLRLLPPAIAFVTLMANVTTARAQTQELLTVDRAVLADAVDNATRRFVHAVASPLTRKKVYFWMQLRGTPELLEKLKSSDGKITIHHVWRRYVFNRVETAFDKSLQIGRAEDISKLDEQVAETGYFTWRIWSDKLNLTSGNWRVDLELNGHEPVMCQNGDEEPQQCSYPFEVE